MTTFNLGGFTFPVGVTNRDVALPPGTAFSSFNISADCSPWVLPGSLDLEIWFSYDNGVTFQHAAGVPMDTPPPFRASKTGLPTSILGVGAFYNSPVQPTNARASVTVGGANPISVAGITITVN